MKRYELHTEELHKVYESIYDDINKYRQIYYKDPNVIIISEILELTFEYSIKNDKFYTHPLSSVNTLFGIKVVTSPRLRRLDYEIY